MKKIDVRISKHDNGKIATKGYYNDRDLLHNDRNPAWLAYYSNGQLRQKRYMRNGKKHRVNGAADFFYDIFGNLLFKSYYRNDKKHRIGGPAITEFTATSKYYSFYINDVHFSWDEYNTKMIDFKMSMI